MSQTRLPAWLTWQGALYCLWAALAIGSSLWIGGTKPENLTRVLVLGFLALTLLARRPLLRLFAPLRPRTRFVVMGCVLACVVEAFHMISKPVFDSLLVTRQTAWSQALLNLGIDLLFTLPAYVVVLGLVWFFINRYAYSLWGYVIVMGMAQALGDGGLFFFVGAPWMLVFLPYPMTNYHAINVLPFLAVREGLQPAKAKGGWLAIPAVVVAYFVCGALIQWAGRLAGLV